MLDEKFGENKIKLWKEVKRVRKFEGLLNVSASPGLKVRVFEKTDQNIPRDEVEEKQGFYTAFSR